MTINTELGFEILKLMLCDKTNSMTRIRCYAGYLTAQPGREFAFTIMLNNFSCGQKEATLKIEELLVELRKL